MLCKVKHSLVAFIFAFYTFCFVILNFALSPIHKLTTYADTTTVITTEVNTGREQEDVFPKKLLTSDCFC